MDLVLHIGAHRTGSTMVERTITATIAAHPDCGVALWAPRRLRDIEGFQATTRRLDGDMEPVDKAAAVALDALATRFAADVAQERARGIKTLIVSEENLMGGMRNNFRQGAFYPDVAQRLAAFDSLFPMSPNRIALGVRDYGSVWSSAYHYLPQAGQTVPPVAAIRDVLLDSKRGWPNVVKAVRKVWADTDILMWQQEQLSDDLRAVCARISGLDADMIVIPDGKINARKPDVARAQVYSARELTMLSKRYARHMRRMRKNGVVQWAV